jgi:hypothetical protein
MPARALIRPKSAAKISTGAKPPRPIVTGTGCWSSTTPGFRSLDMLGASAHPETDLNGAVLVSS